MNDEYDDEGFVARSISASSRMQEEQPNGDPQPAQTYPRAGPPAASRLKRSASDRTLGMRSNDPDDELGVAEVRCSVDGGRASCDLMVRSIPALSI